MKKFLIFAMFVTVTCMATAQVASSDSVKITTKTTTELEKEYTATGTRTLSTGIQPEEPTEVVIKFGEIQSDSIYTIRLKGEPIRYHARQNNDTCYVAFNTDYNEVVRIIFTTDDKSVSPTVGWAGVSFQDKNNKILTVRYEAEHPIEE